MSPGEAALLTDRLHVRMLAIAARTRADSGFRPQSKDLAELEALDAAYAVTCRAEDRATAAWLRSVLLERMGETAAAERLVEAVRDDRDLARLGTFEPGERAALTGAFRALAPRLSALRVRRGAPAAEVFDAIEWAKGRALSDRTAARPVAMADLAAALRGTRTHYWTLLPDEAATFWCLLTADGAAVCGSAPVALGTITSLAQEPRIRPEGRGRPGGNRFAPSRDWQAELAPLALPLAAALAAGQIRHSDTLLVAPHGPLHIFPLQELPLGDVSAGAALRFVRVHGAAAVLAAGAAPPLRPRRAVAFWAPLAEEAHDPGHAASFAATVSILQRHLPTEVIEAAAADVAALRAAARPGLLLHLRAHGDFRHAGRLDRRSGLLLPADGALPAQGTAAWAGGHGFGAADLQGLALEGSHVGLQACVSGYAAANPQGDAIGLEWAFLLGGAASTLGAHWHIDYADATDFAVAFYDAWLGDHASRAEAAWLAGEALRLRGRAAWSAFSLTGDWR